MFSATHISDSTAMVVGMRAFGFTIAIASMSRWFTNQAVAVKYLTNRPARHLARHTT
ncbi:MAG: hypothetical protein ABIQ38_05450 [Ilumatobacteraceae bacterium]